MDDEDNSSYFFKVLVFIISGVGWYLLRKYSCNPTVYCPVPLEGVPKIIRDECLEGCHYFINQGLMEVFFVTLCVISGITIIWVSRYFMTHFTANGISGSFEGRPAIVKDKYGVDWAIYGLGASKYPVPMEGKLATAVLPWSQVNISGRNHVAKTFMPKFPFRKLPPVVYNYIQHYGDKYNKKNVHFGFTTERFIHENPKVIEYETEIKEKNAQINLRTDLLEDRNDILIEQHETLKEIGEQKSPLSFMRRKKEQDEERRE